MSVRDDLLIALQFLTRLPVPSVAAFMPAAQARSLCYYPLVGLLIGGLLWAVGAWLPPGVTTAALLLAVWVLLTGGLHLDGLADSADAWSGGQGDPERTLRIMQDPASGPIGVTAIVLVLLLKFAALAELLAGGGLWTLPLAPAVARAAVPLILLTSRYVRPGGLAEQMSRELPRRALWPIVAVTAGALLLLAGLWALLLLAALLWGLRRSMVVHIGGVTGDTLGATVEIVEAFMLLLLLWFVV